MPTILHDYSSLENHCTEGGGARELAGENLFSFFPWQDLVKWC